MQIHVIVIEWKCVFILFQFVARYRCDTREKPFFVFMTIFYAPSCRSNSYTYIAIMRYHPHRGANNTREGLSPPQKTVHLMVERNITRTLVIFPTKKKIWSNASLDILYFRENSIDAIRRYLAAYLFYHKNGHLEI